MPKEGN